MQSKLFLFLLFAIGCGPIEAKDRGQDLFADAKLARSPSNVFACSTCHDTAPQEMNGPRRQDERIYSGYTVFGAVGRKSYWGGDFALLLDAVNFCLTEFMRGTKLDGKNQDGLALLAYLRSLSPDMDAAKPLSIVKNISAAYLAALPVGDGTRGEAVYRNACAVCHGDIHSGSGRLGPYVSIVPDDTIAGFGTQARAIIAEKIRHGKFFGIGGNMPLYSLEALSEKELSDLLSYLLP